MPVSALEQALAFQIKAAGLPEPMREYRGVPHRKFQFDFAWFSRDGEEAGLLVEVQGGTFAKGKMGHSTGMGQHRDMEKGNLAVLEGWRVLYFDEKMIRSGQALKWLQQALK